MSDTARIGFVVVEYNQASGLPRVDAYDGFGGGEIYRDRSDAEDILSATRAEMAKVGRGETFELAEIRLVRS